MIYRDYGSYSESIVSRAGFTDQIEIPERQLAMGFDNDLPQGIMVRRARVRICGDLYLDFAVQDWNLMKTYARGRTPRNEILCGTTNPIRCNLPGVQRGTLPYHRVSSNSAANRFS